jgi:hypothetical protein
MRPWNDYPEDAEVVYEAKVDPVQIHYVCATTEAYEGLAVVRTKDENLGIVQFWVPVAMQRDFELFLAALQKEVTMSIALPRAHVAEDFEFTLSENIDDRNRMSR